MKNIRIYFCKITDFATVGIVIFSLISVMIAGYIFYNSTQNSEESNKKSIAISTKIQSVVDPEKKIPEKDFNKYTRKAAHFIEFAALGLSLGGIFLCVYKRNKKVFISMPLFIALLVATTDEFIQSFNKRTSRMTDVLIDFSGSITGLVIIFIFALLIYNHSKKKFSK